MELYPILRFKKIKTRQDIASLGGHISRKRKTLNADPKRLHKNINIIGSDNCLSDVDKRMGEVGINKVRKNAVLAVEILCSASPEYFAKGVTGYESAQSGQGWDDAKIKAWVIKTRGWLSENWGVNIVNAKVHLDESTPHLHAVLVPIVGGKLNCRDILGGKAKLSKLQDSYADAMKGLGLVRGKKGSTAKHHDIKEYYSRVNESSEIPNRFPIVKLPNSKLTEKEQVDYLTKQIKTSLKPLYDAARVNEVKVRELKCENKDLKERLCWYEEIGSPIEINRLVERLTKYIELLKSVGESIREHKLVKKAEEIKKAFSTIKAGGVNNDVRKNSRLYKGPTLKK